MKSIYDSMNRVHCLSSFIQLFFLLSQFFHSFCSARGIFPLNIGSFIEKTKQKCLCDNEQQKIID